VSPSPSRLGTQAAVALVEALAAQGVSADVHVGQDPALVYVWTGMVVWCHGGRYWWRSSWDARRQRLIYASHPSTEPARAAQRVALRHARLQEAHASSTSVAGAQPCP
jgi:hypothetical protein